MSGLHLIGLVSTYREGELAASAIRSLVELDEIVVFDGPVEGAEQSGRATVMPKRFPQRTTSETPTRMHVSKGRWETDAAKRTAMLGFCRSAFGGRGDSLWGLWLDGDELLLNGDQLRDWLLRVLETDDPSNPVGGWPLSLVELDGSVSWCMGKLVRLDLIREYLISSSYVELVNGRRITVGNVPAWNPVDGPMQFEETRDGGRRPHWRARLPLQGEPHLLHRPVLRSSSRMVERQHVAEERNFRGVELEGEQMNGAR